MDSALGMYEGKHHCLLTLLVETYAAEEVIFHPVYYFEYKRYIEIDTYRSLIRVPK
jgi:hypothetical protein